MEALFLPLAETGDGIMLSVNLLNRLLVDEECKFQPLTAKLVYDPAPFVRWLAGIQREQGATFLVDNRDRVSIATDAMVLGIAKEFISSRCDFKFSPVKRHLPQEALLNHWIDFDVATQ
ncbi:hypothetical protein ASG39_20080 [Rhizobium sp. Leaf371]|nr:hypothetical protein ASG39_20080 [Rhizobium sp. Leaf371]